MANTSLNKNFSAEGDNIYKWTYSFWVKRSSLGSDQAMAAAYYSSTYQGRILFRSDDQLEVFDYWNGSYTLQKKLNRKFRDTSAWYHIVVSNDNTQASADDRTKIYVNGVQETSFATNTQYPQNQRTTFGNDYTHYIGTGYTFDYLDGSMSHIHFIDGTAYAPTEFGETDSTTGEWKIKTNVSVTYGSNGYFILKDGNSVTDQSGNSNNFTVGAGTLTKTEDNPSNVFATLNPLINPSGATLSNGNTHSNKSSSHAIVQSTIACGYPNAPSTAKFYWETKMEATDGRTVGLIKSNVPQTSSTFNNYLGGASGGDGVIGYWIGTYVNSSQSEVAYNGTAPQITISTGFSIGDIMVHAYDGSTGKYWQGKNGTWFTVGGYVGDPANGNYPLVTLNATDREHFIFPADSSQDGRWSWNFGNGYFKTTAVASAGTNASGIGIFEYDVPTGFTALSTKGLNL